MMSWIFIALGGGLGAVMRAGLMGVVSASTPPYAVLAVNVLGALAIGVVVALLPRDHSLYPLLVTGVLGGFTTFSAFSLEVLQLMQRGEVASALLYALLSVIITVLACAGGYYAIKGIT